MSEGRPVWRIGTGVVRVFGFFRRLRRLWSGFRRRFRLDKVVLICRSVNHGLVAAKQGRIHVAQGNILAVVLDFVVELGPFLVRFGYAEVGVVVIVLPGPPLR
jgi:hypothetical protein